MVCVAYFVETTSRMYIWAPALFLLGLIYPISLDNLYARSGVLACRNPEAVGFRLSDGMADVPELERTETSNHMLHDNLRVE